MTSPASRPGTRPWRISGAGALASPVTVSVAGGRELVEIDLEWSDACRIIGAEYAKVNLFDRLDLHADDEGLEDLRTLADLTNPLFAAGFEAFRKIPIADRFYGPNRGLVMSAFSLPANSTRFSDGTAGVLYVERHETTAIAETTHHWAARLSANRTGPAAIQLVVLSLDVEGVALDLRAPNPAPTNTYHPTDYSTSQQFGMMAARMRAAAIVYDSVRDRPAGECAAVYRPAMVRRCAPVRTITYDWDGVRIAVSS